MSGKRRRTNNKPTKLNMISIKLQTNINTVATSPKGRYKLLESLDRKRKDSNALLKKR